jgi:hypothetical protein
MLVTADAKHLAVAVEAGFQAALLVNDETVSEEDINSGVANLIRLPSKFSYLRDGDVIGISPNARSFRTLYRRGSKHNSFLVTDRCNHYCLMCSQPPKDVDDRWLLDEIRKKHSADRP